MAPEKALDTEKAVFALAGSYNENTRHASRTWILMATCVLLAAADISPPPGTKPSNVGQGMEEAVLTVPALRLRVRQDYYAPLLMAIIAALAAKWAEHTCRGSATRRETVEALLSAVRAERVTPRAVWDGLVLPGTPTVYYVCAAFGAWPRKLLYPPLALISALIHVALPVLAFTFLHVRASSATLPYFLLFWVATAVCAISLLAVCVVFARYSYMVVRADWATAPTCSAPAA